MVLVRVVVVIVVVVLTRVLVPKIPMMVKVAQAMICYELGKLTFKMNSLRDNMDYVTSVHTTRMLCRNKRHWHAIVTNDDILL